MTPTRPRDERRTRRIVAAAVALIVLAGATTGVVRSYQHRQDQLRAARNELRQSLAHETLLREQLAAAQTATHTARAATAGDQLSTANEQTGIRRVALETLAAAHDAEIARQSLQLTTQQRLQLGNAANEVQTCMNAERTTMQHINVGNRAAAASDLNAGKTACSNALAGATGARFPYDFPDPFVLSVGGRYYAFSTNAGAGDVQVITSTNLQDWTFVGNALAGLPSWATPGSTWAPAVLHEPATATQPDAYVMYYTVRDSASGVECISSAVSALPAGPYYDRTTSALVCEAADGGSIDPSPFLDTDGTPWLLWKRERAQQPATIRIQRLAAGGRALTGPAFDLLQSDQAWEHGVVEAPSMVHTGSGYYLFFAGGIWSGSSYATGVAKCDTPIGPCHAQGRPVMVSDATVIGPGGASVFTDNSGSYWLAYASYVNPLVGWPYSRTLRLARVAISPARVTVSPQ